MAANIAVIIPGSDGGLAQFAPMHSLMDAPSGFGFAKDGKWGLRCVAWLAAYAM